MSSTPLTPARFRMEADMLRPLAAAAGVLARNAIVMFEVASTAGVPDVVLLVLDHGALDSRRGTSPLLEPVDVRLMVSTSSVRNPLGRVWSAEDLVQHSGVSVPHLRRTVLPRLVSGGHLAEFNGAWRLAYRYRSMAKRVITIEAKLRDWRGAVGQASRHASVADAAWVALDQPSTGAALENPHWFTTYGVGLLSVSTGGQVKKLIAPGPNRARQPGRELLVERAVALHQEGRHSGEIPRVFGVTLLATTGVDPRLTGVGAR